MHEACYNREHWPLSASRFGLPGCHVRDVLHMLCAKHVCIILTNFTWAQKIGMLIKL
jgi:hypothetical protein